MRARLVASAAILAAISLLLSAPAATANAGARPRTSTTAGEPGTHKIADSPAVLSAIQRYLSQHPGSFSGMWEDQQHRALHIGVARQAASTVVDGIYTAAAAAGRHQAGRFAEWALAFSRAPYSEASLQSTMRSVTTARPWAALSAAWLASWYIDSRGDRVVVGLTHITPSLRKAATAAFGERVRLTVMARPRLLIYRKKLSSKPRVVRVRLNHRRSSPPNSTASSCSRELDCTPYWGGDRLVFWNSSEVIECTQGFPWTPNGKPNTFTMSTTAGHCGPTGRTWYQGYYSSSNNTIYYTGVAGKDTLTQFGNNRVDGEVLSNADMTILVYDSSALTGAGATINSYSQPTQGEKICADGSFTYQSCSGVVQSTNVCVEVNNDGTNVKECDLAYATSGSRLSQSGDSGGPVYSYTSTSPPDVQMHGSITAGNSSGTEMWFSNMNGLDSGLGGHPTT